MKVLGINDQGEYICTVSHTELEKVADKYYGNMEKLKAGATFDLGAGHDFRRDIKTVCRDMATAERSFDAAMGTMHRFAAMVAGLSDPASADQTEAA